MSDQETPIPDDVYEWPESLKDELLEQYGINIKTLTEADDPVALVLAAGMGEATLRARIAGACPFCGECEFEDGICDERLAEDDEASDLCNTCPVCGSDTIIAVCNVIVEYDVNDDGEGGQDWDRSDVDDGTSEPIYFRCDSCKAEWHTFELTYDNNQYLQSLGEPDPKES